MHIDVYTDGSCLGNPGPGGYAFIFVHNNEEIARDFGSSYNTTNNQMELTAVIKALELLKQLNDPNISYSVYTDSSYVVNAFREHWIQKWERNGWRTSTGAKVKNKELWESLVSLTRELNPTFIHVKGHNGDKFNEICDKLAVNAASSVKR